MCENDVDLQSDKLVCDLRVALVASFSPAHIDCNVATFDPTEFAQALHKSSGMLALGRRCRRAQEANRWELRCCACAVSGHAAAPPSIVMNSRRFIRSPRRQ